jgi:hypothetical protein
VSQVKSRVWRAVGAAVLTIALAGLAGASVAAAAPGVSVSALSSLRAGATSGTLRGRVVNETGRASRANVTVRLLRRGTHRKVVGRTSVRVGAKGSAAYAVKVKLPSGLSRGTYYLAACTPYGSGAGVYGCATAHEDVLIKGGTPVRGSAIRAVLSRAAHASAAEPCASGARTLATPGEAVYPETGNGGYLSLHTDISLVYDAVGNLFLPGNHVDLTQRATQCLTDFSLDFERSDGTAAGPNMDVGSVLVNGQPASFRFVQPTYAGDPNGQDDPDPLAHQASQTNPVSAANPNPPACAPHGIEPGKQGQPCPANKLVITPAAPIPSGSDFKVTVNYTGRPGVHSDGANQPEGWFRNNSPVGDGAFVTTEPLGTEAWMPLNNHPSVKPTYDFIAQVTAGRTAIGNGVLVGFTDNAADANFPGGSRTWHWRSPEPIASYLVEGSIGNYDRGDHLAPSGVIFYEFQASAITPATRKASNQVIMDKQEDITNFQSQFNGTYPFSTDGVIIGIPSAGFEEEMQTKITFANSRINERTFHHENMHQWWGDSVSEAGYNLTFFKEGYATLAEYYFAARTAANLVGGQGTAAGDAAFEKSLRDQFNATYAGNGSLWQNAPSKPTSASIFTTASSATYTRPGNGYIALRAILGPQRFNLAGQEIQRLYGGGSVTEPQLIAAFQKYLPNQAAACHARLDLFFQQWWDTAYPPGGGANKPQITGPGLSGPGFYDPATCRSPDTDTTTVGGTVPATLSLSLGTPAAFGAFTPGVAKVYPATATAGVISTAGDALLSVADPSTNAPGHLVNGAFALPQALQATASSPAGTPAAGGAVSGSPLSLLTWAAPVTNDPVTFTFNQAIGANDALRTGSYGKTLTFTLSTTTP